MQNKTEISYLHDIVKNYLVLDFEKLDQFQRASQPNLPEAEYLANATSELRKKIEFKLGIIKNNPNYFPYSQEGTQVRCHFGDLFKGGADTLIETLKAEINELSSIISSINTNANFESSDTQERWRKIKPLLYNLNACLDYMLPFAASEIVLTDVASVKAKYMENFNQLEKKYQSLEQKANILAEATTINGAIKQFEKAKTSTCLQAIGWGFISAVSIGFLFHFIFDALNNNKFDNQINLIKDSFLLERFRLKVIHDSAIQFTLISTLALITTFVCRIFKSHLHLYQQNEHRLRLTHALLPFKEAMTTPDAQDKALEVLLKEVASMGHTGMIPNEQDSFQGHSLVNQFLPKGKD